MKIYISGKISGIDIVDAFEKFRKVSVKLKNDGHIVVNPLEVVDNSKTWKQHMVKDIELLLSCDAIYLLDDWLHSTGARIEKNIAEETGMTILYQQQDNEVSIVIKAIEEVSKVNYANWTNSRRNREGYYNRLLFAFKLQNVISNNNVAKLLNRDHSTTVRYLREYYKEYMYNKQFRKLADSVNLILSKNESQ